MGFDDEAVSKLNRTQDADVSEMNFHSIVLENNRI